MYDQVLTISESMSHNLLHKRPSIVTQLNCSGVPLVPPVAFRHAFNHRNSVVTTGKLRYMEGKKETHSCLLNVPDKMKRNSLASMEAVREWISPVHRQNSTLIKQ